MTNLEYIPNLPMTKGDKQQAQEDIQDTSNRLGHSDRPAEEVLRRQVEENETGGEQPTGDYDYSG